MNNENTVNIFEVVGFSILFPIISIGCCFGFAYLERMIGFWQSVGILGIVLVFVTLITYFAGKVLTSLGNDNLSVAFELSVKVVQDELSQNTVMDGIYFEDHLAIMERNKFFEEIWLISPDLRTEIEQGVYAGVVRDNLKKGTEYKYFVPNTTENRVRVKKFLHSCNHNKKLKIFYLDDTFFFLVPDLDFAIYEPLKSYSGGMNGYMGIKIQGSSERYAVLMNQDFVDALVSKLDERVQSNASSGVEQ